jgi:AbrB family looped-hinge helix DNA binding protein
MTTASIKITSKGQVTIPKEIRDRLKTTSVYFEVEDNNVMLKPVYDAAGSLNEYALKAPADRSMKQMKEKAWEEALREKTGKKSS